MCPQNCGIQFVRCQHQRRHVKALLKDIPNARLSPDRDVLRLQGRDIAIHRTLGGPKLLPNFLCRDWAACAAQELHDFE